MQEGTAGVAGAKMQRKRVQVGGLGCSKKGLPFRAPNRRPPYGSAQGAVTAPAKGASCFVTQLHLPAREEGPGVTSDAVWGAGTANAAAASNCRLHETIRDTAQALLLAVKLAATCGSVWPPCAPVRTSHVPCATLDSALPLGQISGSLSLRGSGEGVRSRAGTSSLVHIQSDRPRPTHRAELAVEVATSLGGELTRSSFSRRSRCTSSLGRPQ